MSGEPPVSLSTKLRAGFRASISKVSNGMFRSSSSQEESISTANLNEDLNERTSLSSPARVKSLPSPARAKDEKVNDEAHHDDDDTAITRPKSKSDIGHIFNALTIASEDANGSVHHYAVFPALDVMGEERFCAGLGKDRAASWRIPIYGDFETLCDRKTQRVSQDKFRALMLKRGTAQSWIDAAYHSFNSRSDAIEGLNRFQFLLAVCSLSLNKHGTNTSIDKDAILTTTGSQQANTIIRNEQWISLRRYVIFNYHFAGSIASIPSDYLSLFASANENDNGDNDNEMKEEAENEERSANPTLPSSGSSCGSGDTGASFSKYVSFIDSLSSSEEDPQYWGISNTRWTHYSRDMARREELQSDEGGTLSGSGSIKLGSNSSNDNTHNNLAQSLAISKVQLASKQDELEEMQLQFLQLEKKFCALKLELATERANKG